MAKDFLSVYKDNLNDLIERRMQVLTTGSVDDLGAFKELRGTIQGLVLAKQTLEDLAKDLLKEDDDDSD